MLAEHKHATIEMPEKTPGTVGVTEKQVLEGLVRDANNDQNERLAGLLHK